MMWQIVAAGFGAALGLESFRRYSLWKQQWSRLPAAARDGRLVNRRSVKVFEGLFWAVLAIHLLGGFAVIWLLSQPYSVTP
jgi:hypothetical protein